MPVGPTGWPYRLPYAIPASAAAGDAGAFMVVKIMFTIAFAISRSGV